LNVIVSVCVGVRHQHMSELNVIVSVCVGVRHQHMSDVERTFNQNKSVGATQSPKRFALYTRAVILIYVKKEISFQV
jgi:hypothetical protein